MKQEMSTGGREEGEDLFAHGDWADAKFATCNNELFLLMLIDLKLSLKCAKHVDQKKKFFLIL